MKMKTDEKRANWLLIKRPDKFAHAEGEPEPIDVALDSVKSGKTNLDLEKSRALRPDHKARASKSSSIGQTALMRLPGAKKGILPPFVEPSLAQLVSTPPEGEGWIYEIKHDGYRMEARLDGGKVKLLTRAGLDWSKRFPTIMKALEQMPVKAALLDGEIIVQDLSGHHLSAGPAGRPQGRPLRANDLLCIRPALLQWS